MFDMRSLFSSRNNDRPERCCELCMVLDGVFADVKPLIRVGTTTAELDHAAATSIKARGCEPLFRNNPRNDFPATITASVNEQVVNNLPSERELRQGDLLSLQIGVQRERVFAYQAWTFFVEEVNEIDKPLWEAGLHALNNAISNVRVGSTVRDVSAAIQSTLESAGCAPGRDYLGHGIGDDLHVEPAIPCYVGRGRSHLRTLNYSFVKNQLLSINVFAHAGSHRTRLEADQWGVVSRDGSHSVHFSHIVAAKSDGCMVLTPEHHMTTT